VIYEVEQLYGGKVESADPREQFGEGSTGSLLRSIHAWRAEQERELIILRTQGGRKARAQSGKLIPTRFPLYGYLWADPDTKHGKTRYILDPETAPIVQRIFADALRGIPMRRIANDLTREGVLCPSELLIRRGFTPASRYSGSNAWAQPTIQTILSNSAYMGQHVAYRRSTTSEHRRDETGEMRLMTETKLRAEDDPARVVLSPDVCPPIVSEETFRAVAERRAQNKLESRRNNKGILGLLRGGYGVCGYCGRRMMQFPPSKSHPNASYHCQGAHNPTRNLCPAGKFSISLPILDGAAWTVLRYISTKPETVRALLESRINHTDANASELERQRAKYEGRVAEVEAQRKRALAATLRATDDDAHAMWAEQTERLLAERRGLEAELTELIEGIEIQGNKAHYLRSIEDWCLVLAQHIAEATYEEKRHLLFALDVVATVYRTDRTPRYTIRLDAAGLNPQIAHLLSFTNEDMERLERDFVTTRV